MDTNDALLRNFNKCIEILDRIIESPEELDELISQFQKLVWDTPREKEDMAWEILGDLAYDLDFYEPNPVWRAEDPSYYDKDRALEVLKIARHKLTEMPLQ